MNNHQDEEIEFWPIIFIAAIGIAAGMIQVDPRISVLVVSLSLYFLSSHLFEKKTKIERDSIAEDQNIKTAVSLMGVALFSFALLFYLPIESIRATIVVVAIVVIMLWILVLSGEERNKIRIRKLENNIKETVLILGILWFVPLNLILAVLATIVFLALATITILLYKFEA